MRNLEKMTLLVSDIKPESISQFKPDQSRNGDRYPYAADIYIFSALKVFEQHILLLQKLIKDLPSVKVFRRPVITWRLHAVGYLTIFVRQHDAGEVITQPARSEFSFRRTA